ncbi:unnamed protein product [Chrysoparadoxa australica]
MMEQGWGEAGAGPVQQWMSPPKEEVVTVEPPPGFDLESYIGRYSGRTRVLRLLFIAKRCPALAPAALRMALTDLKAGCDTQLYRTVIAKGAELGLGPDYALDAAWVAQVERRAAQTYEHLEQELNSHKTCLNKESIRASYTEMGDFHARRGDLQAAMKSYVRTRDYCGTSRQSAEMCLSVIGVGVDLSNFMTVSNYVIKAEHSSGAKDPVTLAKLKVVTHVFFLDTFLFDCINSRLIIEPVSPEISGSFNSVIAPEDVAVYGALCGLAALPRDSVRSSLLENPHFKAFVEMVPEVASLVEDFFHSRYGPFLQALDAKAAELALDIHMHRHVPALRTKIRNSAAVQYFRPYSSIRLSTMAESFGLSFEEMEHHMAALIGEGVILARIDKAGGTLHTAAKNSRLDSYRKVVSTGEHCQRELQAALLRLSCMKAGMVVKGMPGGGIVRDAAVSGTGAGQEGSEEQWVGPPGGSQPLNGMEDDAEDMGLNEEKLNGN